MVEDDAHKCVNEESKNIHIHKIKPLKNLFKTCLQSVWRNHQLITVSFNKHCFLEALLFTVVATQPNPTNTHTHLASAHSWQHSPGWAATSSPVLPRQHVLRLGSRLVRWSRWCADREPAQTKQACLTYKYLHVLLHDTGSEREAWAVLPFQREHCERRFSVLLS